jgi:hypothetical protein
MYGKAISHIISHTEDVQDLVKKFLFLNILKNLIGGSVKEGSVLCKNPFLWGSWSGPMLQQLEGQVRWGWTMRLKGYRSGLVDPGQLVWTLIEEQ